MIIPHRENKVPQSESKLCGAFVCCDSHIACNCCTFAAASLQTNCSATAKLLQCCCKPVCSDAAKVCSRFAVAVQYDSKLCMAMLQRAEKD